MLDYIIIVSLYTEGMTSKHEELGRTESETQEMIEEEVVQFIWAYKILGLLADVAILVGRDKFWRNRSIDNVEQRQTRLFVDTIIGYMAYKIAYEGLGYAGIDPIH